MLTTRLIHPDLLAALARMGHGSRILIADGNYPHVTGTHPTAERIHLNVTPGLLTVDQVLELIAETVPLEAVQWMDTADGGPSEATAGHLTLLGDLEGGASGLERFAFYEAARQAGVGVVVATGDTRAYANVLLTVGVRRP
jgi:L-fucose mutarotase